MGKLFHAPDYSAGVHGSAPVVASVPRVATGPIWLGEWVLGQALVLAREAQGGWEARV